MIKTKKIKVEEDSIVDIYCDWCKRRFRVGQVNCDKKLVGGGQGEIYFGYGSIFDDDTYKFEICDNCFKQNVKDKAR